MASEVRLMFVGFVFFLGFMGLGLWVWVLGFGFDWVLGLWVKHKESQ